SPASDRNYLIDLVARAGLEPTTSGRLGSRLGLIRDTCARTYSKRCQFAGNASNRRSALSRAAGATAGPWSGIGRQQEGGDTGAVRNYQQAVARGKTAVGHLREEGRAGRDRRTEANRPDLCAVRCVQPVKVAIRGTHENV